MGVSKHGSFGTARADVSPWRSTKAGTVSALRNEVDYDPNKRYWSTRMRKPALVIGILISIAVIAVTSRIAISADADAKKTAGAKLEITADSFKCLAKMTKVKHFFVDNLLGNVSGTVAIAQSEHGGVYPPGSVVQLVPGEVMVKHEPGFNAVTRDWEFFELDTAATGSTIRKRGVGDVVNRFGGNCFGCHVKARPEFDLICENDHGCDPIPITREQIAKIQEADPRCK
jgi:hypothetical protein